MKVLFAFALSCALASSALAGPDFTVGSPRPRPLATSSASTVIEPSDDVVFAFDSDQLSESARAQIDSAAQWLRTNERNLVVEGYADATGKPAHNEELAARRAHMVRQELLRRGVASDRILILVYGAAVAHGGDDPLDRRVVLYASRESLQRLAARSFQRKGAQTAMWTRGSSLIRARNTEVIGTR